MSLKEGNNKTEHNIPEILILLEYTVEKVIFNYATANKSIFGFTTADLFELLGFYIKQFHEVIGIVKSDENSLVTIDINKARGLSSKKVLEDHLNKNEDKIDTLELWDINMKIYKIDEVKESNPKEPYLWFKNSIELKGIYKDSSNEEKSLEKLNLDNYANGNYNDVQIHVKLGIFDLNYIEVISEKIVKIIINKNSNYSFIRFVDTSQQN